MKMKLDLICVAVVASASLFMFSCSNPFSGKASENSATGVLSLSVGNSAGARTIAPSAGDLAIESYDIVVSRSGFSDRTATITAPETEASFSGLEPGAWTIAVNGMTSGGLVIATGTSPVTIALPGPTFATVNLDYASASTGNTGGMGITLVFPTSEGVDSVSAYLDEVAITPDLTVIHNGDGTDKVVCAVADLSAASVTLRISLERNSVVVLPWAEQVWIYSNVTTTKTETIQAAAFSAAPPAPSTLTASLVPASDFRVDLSWPNVNIAETYTLERSGNGGSDYTVLSSAIAAGSTANTDTPPTLEAKTFRYRLLATNTFGTSAYKVNTVDVVMNPADIVAYDAANVSLTYASGDSIDSVTQDLGLVSSPCTDSTVSWASSNPAITDDGTVTRPDGSDSTGDLTATITHGSASDTKVFALTVKATGTGGITVMLPTAPSATGLVFQNSGSTIASFTVTRGTPVTVTTTFADAAYAWYVDGSTSAVSTTSSCELDGTLYTAGNHTLLLDAYAGGKYYSGRIGFTVITPTASAAWTAVGVAEGLSDGSARLTDIAINSAGIPYVVYGDEAAGIKATVKKYNGLAWESVGSAGFSAGVIWSADIAISSSGTPYVAYWDMANGDGITVMKFNGTSWEVVGYAGFGTVSATPRIALDSAGTPYVTFYNSYSSDKATVMKFNGTSWEAVGTTGFTAGAAYSECIAFDSLNTPYVAYMDDANGRKVTVQKFDGTNWVLVGTAGFTPNSINHLNIAIDSSGNPYVAYKDEVTYKANVMKFSDDTWASVGAADFTGQINKGIGFAMYSGTPYIVYDDETNDYKTTARKFNGTGWVSVGNAGFSPGSFFHLNMAISSLGIPYVVFMNEVMMDFGDPFAELPIQKAMVMRLE